MGCLKNTSGLFFRKNAHKWVILLTKLHFSAIMICYK